MAKRTRNHRRNECSTCEKITQAHYFVTKNEPVLEILEQIKKTGVQCYDIYGTPVFIFSDGSLLAYTDKRGLYKVDSFLRKSERRLA